MFQSSFQGKTLFHRRESVFLLFPNRLAFARSYLRGLALPGSVGTPVSGEMRLKELEALFVEGPESAHETKAMSTETLLDILLILYNECCSSSLRKEKTVTEFIELGETSERN